MRAALSQVSLVSGFGNSCSQPLLAKRPSKSVGSGRNKISREFPVSWALPVRRRDLGLGCRVSETDVNCLTSRTC